ncbi:5-hydroxytryptamine receptor 2A-like [Anastrepha ludens]|uniref:5-hydroxytryptamine receptor 2A-like n=1 Tax=Anastrepha ludens TaxID=28586 RepID=UPI0023AF1AD0|nr:5-hydroxytryptamine receptor 2A-like [Anastrepha ludens]
MTKLKDAHDYIFIAEGGSSSSSSGSNSYVISSPINAKQLRSSISNNNSNSRNYRRSPFGAAPTKRPKPPHTKLSTSLQPHQLEHQDQKNIQHRMVVSKAHNATTTATIATAAATTTAATMGLNSLNSSCSLVAPTTHTALESNRIDSNSHQLQQSPLERHHLHHQHTFVTSFAAPTLNTALTTTATTVLTAAKAAATTTATTAAQNLYSGVAVGLGAMLINDTLLLEADTNGYGTSLLFDDGNGSDLMLNGSSGNITNGNATASDEDFGEFLRIATTSVMLGLLILITIIGNVFVIAAIILERNLQNVANYLVASLAVADLFVACLVMPLGAVYEIRQGWILGPELCDIWTSCDVLCCTASILHLVAIAVDRQTKSPTTIGKINTSGEERHITTKFRNLHKNCH